MQLTINGKDTFVATGGREFDRSQPAVVLLHGAGFDHSTWALQSRWFAHHGFGVLAPDLPGHGRSSGAPLSTIAEMADWTAALLDAAGAAKAKLHRLRRCRSVQCLSPGPRRRDAGGRDPGGQPGPAQGLWHRHLLGRGDRLVC